MCKIPDLVWNTVKYLIRFLLSLGWMEMCKIPDLVWNTVKY